jgi:hypothetical protein
MSCRTGPLRAERPLRGVSTLFQLKMGSGPPVGREQEPVRYMLPVPTSALAAAGLDSSRYCSITFSRVP